MAHVDVANMCQRRKVVRSSIEMHEIFDLVNLGLVKFGSILYLFD
jgi:hypothetical protein